jgi:hypothetical protein
MPSGNDATNLHSRISTLEGLIVQLVTIVTKTNPSMSTREGTKIREQVGNVVVQSSMMEPIDLDKSFEGTL